MPRPNLRWRATLGALSSLLIFTTAAPALAEDTSPSPAPAPTTTATLLAAKTYPGVQLISTTYTATVTVDVPTLNQDAVVTLAQRLLQQALNGGIDSTEEAITEEIVDAIVKSPNTYFIAGGGTYSRKASLVGVGTGWAITPDGYLITAAHVVKSPARELRAEFANTALNKFGRQFIRGVQSSGTTFTNDQINRLTNAIMNWLAYHMSVNNLHTSVAADIALSFDGLGKDQKPVEAEVVDVGKPYPGSDVALLKIDGQEHLPTIDVGTNDDVSPGSTVHVVGFPAASTFYAGLSHDSQVQPTVTEGPVTAIKSTPSGMPVIQTQAPVSPGNSGGPVVTDGGQSVGVLVANAVGSDGVAAQGQNFVIPASEVLDMLERNGVTPKQSDTTKAYNEAIDDFYAEHYSAALPLLEKVETLYPAHPFAQKFITDAKTAIDEGRDKTPQPTSWGKRLLIGGLALLGLALLAGLAVALAMASKRRKAAAAVAVPAGAPAAGYPGAPGYPNAGGYPNVPGYPQQPGYPAGQGYPTGQGYPNQPGYPTGQPGGQPAWGPVTPPGYPYPQGQPGHYPGPSGGAAPMPGQAMDEPGAPLWRGPVADEPVFDQPVVDQPVATDPVPDAPFADPAVADQPVVDSADPETSA